MENKITLFCTLKGEEWVYKQKTQYWWKHTKETAAEPETPWQHKQM